jgi:hypothetical protein
VTWIPQHNRKDSICACILLASQAAAGKGEQDLAQLLVAVRDEVLSQVSLRLPPAVRWVPVVAPQRIGRVATRNAGS